LTDLTVGSGSLTPLTVRLLPEGKLGVRVTDLAGNPVANAALQVFDVTGVGLLSYWAVRTDVMGSAEIGTLPPGTYTVGARIDPRQATSPAVAVRAGDTTSVEIQLP
jgi:Carboxypeptidase regulatory-like domain